MRRRPAWPRRDDHGDLLKAAGDPDLEYQRRLGDDAHALDHRRLLVGLQEGQEARRRAGWDGPADHDHVEFRLKGDGRPAPSHGHLCRSAEGHEGEAYRIALGQAAGPGPGGGGVEGGAADAGEVGGCVAAFAAPAVGPGAELLDGGSGQGAGRLRDPGQGGRLHRRRQGMPALVVLLAAADREEVDREEALVVDVDEDDGAFVEIDGAAAGQGRLVVGLVAGGDHMHALVGGEEPAHAAELAVARLGLVDGDGVVHQAVGVELPAVVPGARVAEVVEEVDAAGEEAEEELVLLGMAAQAGVAQAEGAAVLGRPGLEDAEAVAIEESRGPLDGAGRILEQAADEVFGVGLPELADAQRAILGDAGAGVPRVLVLLHGIEVLVGEEGGARLGTASRRRGEVAGVADADDMAVVDHHIDMVVEEGPRLRVIEERRVAVRGEDLRLSGADLCHQAVDADEVQLDGVVAGALVAAAVAVGAVDDEEGRLADAVVGVVDHVAAVGALFGVVIEDEGHGQGRRLVEALIAVDPAGLQAAHAGAQDVGLDVAPEVVGAAGREALGAGEGEDLRVGQGFVEGVVGVGGGLQAEGLPDQIGDHAALLPGVVRVLVVEGPEVGALEAVLESRVIPAVVRVLRGESGQEDAALAGVGHVVGEQVGLRE